MRFAFSIALFAALSVGSTQLAAADPELFSVLKTDDDVYAMDLTEDQKLLVLAHKDADRVTIWDILTNTEVGSIDTPAPAFVLCRGTRIYVANYGHGLVSVFDAAKQWEKVAEVKTGLENVAVLAAPGGKAFTGQLLGLCDLSKKEKQMIFVDTIKKKSAALGKGDFAGIAVDFDGKNYFWQVNGGSPARYIPGTKSWPLLVAGRDSPQQQGMMDTLPILRQVQPGTFWFGGDRVSKGMPPAFVGDARGQFVIGDRSKQLGYALLTDDTGHYLEAFELKGTLSQVGKRLIQFPKEYHRFAPKFWANPHVTHLHDYQNIGVTGADGKLRVYVYECFDKLVWTLTTEAFPGDDVRGQKGPPIASNQPEKPPMEIVIAPVDKDFRTWTDTTGSFSVVAKFLAVVDGKVKLQKADGKESLVPLAKLSAADQAFVKSVAVQPKPMDTPFESTAPSPSTPKPPTVASKPNPPRDLPKIPANLITAQGLVEQYDKDEAATDGKYKDKQIIVSGMVMVPMQRALFGKDITVLLSWPGEENKNVRCVLNPAAHAEAETLWPGQLVKLTGTGAGLLQVVPTVLDCKFMEILPMRDLPTVTADTLIEAYTDDLAAASKTYDGKPIYLEATVASIDKTDQIVYLQGDKDAKVQIRFSWAAPEKSLVADLAEGKKLKLKAVSGGKLDIQKHIALTFWQIVK
jgi:hypothetical protein